MDIFSIIDGIFFIIFFNKENFKQVVQIIQIWVRLLRNIVIHKGYFLGLVS